MDINVLKLPGSSSMYLSEITYESELWTSFDQKSMYAVDGATLTKG